MTYQRGTDKKKNMQRKGLISGGGYSEVIYDANGQQIAAMDMGNTQQQLSILAAMMEELQRKQRQHTNTPTPFINTKRKVTGTRQRKEETSAGGSKGCGGTFFSQTEK
ncbi:uncharacterized protein TM35_000102820 [Trypanosoma theileri]|uniref:Uncharacterized protein n=1 Tax=Trypanosoma theileri TaxID=67003 RepID=A0A1X0NZ98_9TRYP|nr:uncharacterized protein TM35_000102820 [Trypanosoma theileri]ORC90014.1 hypothetical protein TM35_000102820 [Trypanosoma theileri]